MRISSDLFRNFTIGFVAGVIGIVVANGVQSGHLESPAHAANPGEASISAPEFAIEPLEIIR